MVKNSSGKPIAFPVSRRKGLLIDSYQYTGSASDKSYVKFDYEQLLFETFFDIIII